jgi:uncharacterized repeat protein (TIGR01451 family)
VPLEIPGNLAGGFGPSTIPSNYQPGLIPVLPVTDGPGVVPDVLSTVQWLADQRFWQCIVRVTPYSSAFYQVHFSVATNIQDTVELVPGDLGTGLARAFTVPMAFLESHNDAFDAPFRIQYLDSRFPDQIVFLPLPSNCPQPPPPPPPPGHHGDTGKNRSGNSGDPNNLVGPAGFGPQGFVDGQETLPYTIDFENEPTATAPAQQVTVTDQLPANLDWSTVQLTGVGFNGVTLTPPAGVRNYDATATVATDANHPVQVHVTFDPSSGVLTWTLTSLDPVTGKLVTDPLAGFLPPDNAQQQGEGFVSFTARAKAGLATGATITNQAQVVFDVNAPINTPAVLNTIDAGPPTSTVLALPATETGPSFPVPWSGSSAPGGSGIGSFDVYVADNGGAFTPWLTGTTATLATFTGQDGHSYAFYSVSTDNVGHVQPTPAAAQASTTVVAPPALISTPGPEPVHDVSTQVSVGLGRLRRKGKRLRQTVTLHNLAGTALEEPLSLVLDGLPRKVTLVGAAGTTQAQGRPGSPYVNVTPAGGALPPNGTMIVVLAFRGPAGSHLRYSTRVLAGIGPR